LLSIALFLAGWSCGWLLLWRLPVPPRAVASAGPSRPRLAVVVPARDEAAMLPALLASVQAQLREGDELVVVDDHSTDGTAAVASACDARVLAAPELADGWAGKPAACHAGAMATTAALLVFVDADVVLADGALDRLALAQAASGAVVSVQPWHQMAGPVERLSLVFNLTALMGGGSFSAWRGQVRHRLAYGPVLLLDRERYEAVGGYANPAVRGAVAEDLALARLVGRSLPFAGRRLASFRMYPQGACQLVRGWTKNIATGAGNVPWWAGALVVAWIWSLAGGVFASWWCVAASVVQVAVQGRRVGRYGLLSALLYPLLLAFFLAVFLRSVVLTATGSRVRWRGRLVPTRAP